jgi:hypothetical protein
MISNLLPTEKAYWIIVSDEGHASVPYRHETYTSAYEESVRLSKIKPGVKFNIFKYLGHSVATEPVVKHYAYTEPVTPTNGFWIGYQPRWSNQRDQIIPF